MWDRAWRVGGMVCFRVCSGLWGILLLLKCRYHTLWGVFNGNVEAEDSTGCVGINTVLTGTTELKVDCELTLTNELRKYASVQKKVLYPRGNQLDSVLRGQRSEAGSSISTLSTSCSLGSGDAGVEICSPASRSLSSMTTGATVHSAISNRSAGAFQGWGEHLVESTARGWQNKKKM